MYFNACMPRFSVTKLSYCVSSTQDVMATFFFLTNRIILISWSRRAAARRWRFDLSSDYADDAMIPQDQTEKEQRHAAAKRNSREDFDDASDHEDLQNGGDARSVSARLWPTAGRRVLEGQWVYSFRASRHPRAKS